MLHDDCVLASINSVAGFCGQNPSNLGDIDGVGRSAYFAVNRAVNLKKQFKLAPL